MEMHQVRYFLAVARTLNFTRAAEESNVTQPSLTRAIQKLEEEFGGVLFRRERALTHLTDLGRMMLPHLERTHEAAQAAKALAKGIGKVVSTPLHLGLAAVLPGDGLSASLADVGAHLPGFELRISTGEDRQLLDEMLKGDLDIIIFAAPRVPHERLDLFELFEQSYAVVVPAGHPLNAAIGVTMADLAMIGWIDCGGDVTEEFRECSRASSITLEFRHSVTNGADAARLIAAGLGVAILARDEALPTGLSFIDVSDLALTRKVALASVSGRKRSAAADALIRAARARRWT